MQVRRPQHTTDHITIRDRIPKNVHHRKTIQIHSIHANNPSTSWLQKASYTSKADFLFLYNEIHVDKCYEQFNVQLRPDQQCIIDVGANIGMFSTRAAQSINASGLVIALEPIPSTFKTLCHNINIHNEYYPSSATVKCIQAGVGAANTLGTTMPFTLYPRAAGWSTLSKYETSSSIKKDMDTFLNNALDDSSLSTALPSYVKTIGRSLKNVAPVLYTLISRAAVSYMLSKKQYFNCPMTTVSDLIRKYTLDHIDILKIDVERAEVDVLRGIDDVHWPRIGNIVIEVHEENLVDVLDIIENKAQFINIQTIQSTDLKNTSIYLLFAWR